MAEYSKLVSISVRQNYFEVKGYWSTQNEETGIGNSIFSFLAENFYGSPGSRLKKINAYLH